MKKFLSVLVCVMAAVILLQSNVYADGPRELLVNGSAENDLEGWTASSDSWMATEKESPRTGKQFFAGETVEGTLYQDVNISNYATGTAFLLSGYMKDYENKDIATMKISFLNASGNVLKEAKTSTVKNYWTHNCVMELKPKNAVTLRVSLIAKRISGHDCDGYFDDMSLTTTTKRVISKNTKNGQNVLMNGGFEDDVYGWEDPNNAWKAVTTVEDHHYPCEGQYVVWPSLKEIANTKIYQDVFVTKDMEGKYVKFSSKVANYLQDNGKCDQTIIKLQFMNENKEVMKEINNKRRSEKWATNCLVYKIPKRTIKIRVVLEGKRYIGDDCDAYFDNASLCVISNADGKMSIKGLKATKVKKNTLTLQWKKCNGAEYYLIYHAKGNSNGYKKVQKVLSNKVTIKKLRTKTKYKFKVVAVNSSGKVSKVKTVRTK